MERRHFGLTSVWRKCTQTRERLNGVPALIFLIWHAECTLPADAGLPRDCVKQISTLAIKRTAAEPQNVSGSPQKRLMGNMFQRRTILTTLLIGVLVLPSHSSSAKGPKGKGGGGNSSSKVKGHGHGGHGPKGFDRGGGAAKVKYKGSSARYKSSGPSKSSHAVIKGYSKASRGNNYSSTYYAWPGNYNRGYKHGNYTHGGYNGYGDLLYLGLSFLPWLDGHADYAYYGPPASYYPGLAGYPYYQPYGYAESDLYDAPSAYAVESERLSEATYDRPTSGEVGYRSLAEEAFRSGQYEEAARLARHALIETPDDGGLHEFMGQVLFAVGDYRGAAVALHQMASLQQPEDWGEVVRNYTQYYRGRDYVEQMGRLTEYIKQHPEAAYAWFVRGYHYGFLGHQEAACGDLAKALELESRDRLAERLLVRFGGAVEPESTEEIPPPPLPSQAVPPSGI